MGMLTRSLPSLCAQASQLVLQRFSSSLSLLGADLRFMRFGLCFLKAVLDYGRSFAAGLQPFGRSGS